MCFKGAGCEPVEKGGTWRPEGVCMSRMMLFVLSDLEKWFIQTEQGMYLNRHCIDFSFLPRVGTWLVNCLPACETRVHHVLTTSWLSSITISSGNKVWTHGVVLIGQRDLLAHGSSDSLFCQSPGFLSAKLTGNCNSQDPITALVYTESGRSKVVAHKAMKINPTSDWT